MIDKRERVYQAFGAFVKDLVKDLNQRHEDGWVLLVEGARDVKALRSLGYVGKVVTVSSVTKPGPVSPDKPRKVIILTDLDREGGRLAGRFARRLAHEGIKTSLSERRRLQRNSRGVFLHIENLSRFAVSALDSG